MKLHWTHWVSPVCLLHVADLILSWWNWVGKGSYVKTKPNVMDFSWEQHHRLDMFVHRHIHLRNGHIISNSFIRLWRLSKAVLLLKFLLKSRFCLAEGSCGLFMCLWCLFLKGHLSYCGFFKPEWPFKSEWVFWRACLQIELIILVLALQQRNWREGFNSAYSTGFL